MTVSGAPRSEACRKANSRTGRDSGSAVGAHEHAGRGHGPSPGGGRPRPGVRVLGDRRADRAEDRRGHRAAAPRADDDEVGRLERRRRARCGDRCRRRGCATSRSGAVTAPSPGGGDERPGRPRRGRGQLAVVDALDVEPGRVRSDGAASAQCTTVSGRCSRCGLLGRPATARSASAEPSTPTTMLPGGSWPSVMVRAFCADGRGAEHGRGTRLRGTKDPPACPRGPGGWSRACPP